MPEANDFALLWSQSQCALHIEPLADMLSENRSAYADNRRRDYVPIHIGPRDECEEAAEGIRSTMRQRQERRGALEGWAN